MIDVLSPSAGTVGALADVPDPVFAAEMVGSGVSIDPPRERAAAVAPIAGTVLKAHPHAVVITADDGTGVLIHLGIDTVQLEGEGFTVLAPEQSRVAAGDPLVDWDPGAVEAGGRSPLVLLCLLDTAPGGVRCDRIGDDVAAGDPLFSWAG